MTRWSGSTYQAKRSAHRWRIVSPGVQQCRSCDLIRHDVKYRIFEYREPGKLVGVLLDRTPACAGVQ